MHRSSIAAASSIQHHRNLCVRHPEALPLIIALRDASRLGARRDEIATPRCRLGDPRANQSGMRAAAPVRRQRTVAITSEVTRLTWQNFALSQ